MSNMDNNVIKILSKQIQAQIQQQQKHYKKVWTMLKVVNKGTKTTPMTSCWYLYCFHYVLVSLFLISYLFPVFLLLTMNK